MKRKTQAVVSSILTVSALAVWPAFADVPPADINESNALAEVVVTAQRRGENLERTPLSVTAISADMLNERAITTDSELQSAVPGLTIRESSNSNDLSFAIRGQSVDAYSNSPPAVLQYFNELQITPNSGLPFMIYSLFKC